MDLIFRADASATLGMGHVMRCLALAQACLRQDHSCRAALVGLWQGDAVKQRIARVGVEAWELSAAYPAAEDLQTTLAVLQRHEAAREPTTQRPWLVLDGYHFDQTYQREIRAAGYPLLVVDDAAHLSSYHADIILNQNLGAETYATRYQRPPHTRLLLGSRFALLREEFVESGAWQRQIPPVARKVLLTLGGSDPHNSLGRIVEALEHVAVDGLDVTVVAGTANAHGEELAACVRSSSRTVRLVKSADDMAALMRWADVAISASGSSCLEMARLGLPAIILAVAPNQQAVAQSFTACDLAMHGGPGVSPDLVGIAAKLTEICHDWKRRRRMSQRGPQLVDGRGASRVLRHIRNTAEEHSAKPTHPVLRPAAPEDALLIWALANDPTVRMSSFDNAAIPLQTHLDWYDKVLTSADQRMWVLADQDELIGQIRYSRVEPGIAHIHFAVHPRYRAQGFGTRLLETTWEDACRELALTRIRGFVKTTNPASAHAFKKAGFERIEQPTGTSDVRDVFERVYADSWSVP